MSCPVNSVITIYSTRTNMWFQDHLSKFQNFFVAVICLNHSCSGHIPSFVKIRRNKSWPRSVYNNYDSLTVFKADDEWKDQFTHFFKSATTLPVKIHMIFKVDRSANSSIIIFFTVILLNDYNIVLLIIRRDGNNNQLKFQV